MCKLSIGEPPKCNFVGKTIYIRFPYASSIFFGPARPIILRIIGLEAGPPPPYCGVYGLGYFSINDIILKTTI
jgi:hypothetical protein